MQNKSIIKRLVYNYLGIMLWVIHWTDTHKILGVLVSNLIRLFALLLPVGILTAGWGRNFAIIGILIFLWIHISYWRARRTGYYHFVADDVELMAAENPVPLPMKKHIKVSASGIFSVKDWEKNAVLKPAEYWQAPLGDHAVMVEHEPGRYLYQFFNATTMQELKIGWLLFGTRPRPALAVTFLSSWGPEFNDENVSLLRRNNNNGPQKIRTIYLSFTSKEQELAVWHNLIFDARRVRSGQTI
jgi:hypothetical protein